MYQVVASDLDGTLLSPDHFLTPYAKETLKLLTARGKSTPGDRYVARKSGQSVPVHRRRL